MTSNPDIMDIRTFYKHPLPQTPTSIVTDVATLFAALLLADKTMYLKRVQYMMQEFGTSLQCNRFDIGNTHERLIADVITQVGCNVSLLTNAKRVDICVNDIEFSIKYSGSSNIRLHNSLGTNRDVTVTNTLLVTPTEWWFLDMAKIAECGVNINDYLVNKSDCLELKRSILAALHRASYPYTFELDLEVSSDVCKHRPTYEIFYAHVCAKVPE
jgi:hypothetical protein